MAMPIDLLTKHQVFFSYSKELKNHDNTKLFCKIVNSRLTKWAEENDLMYEEQAGFTKGKSTIDQVFILQTIIQKYLDKKKGRCYNVFIDFSKAFDSIPHSHLFYLLCQNGAHSRVLKVMQNMYSKLQSCVKKSYLSC